MAALYREHRGMLDEALKTVITVTSLDDVKEHYSNDPAFSGLTDYKCEYYAQETRVEGWTSTYIITAIYNGQQIVIGFSNALLESSAK